MTRWRVDKIELINTGMTKIKVPEWDIEQRVNLYTDILKYKKWRYKWQKGLMDWNKFLRHMEYD